jgi:hypothetical protein
VFAQGGFDVVVGNPPWERIKLQEEEFFASRHQGIAEAQNKAKRQKLIDGLMTGTSLDQSLHHEFLVARRTAEASSQYAHVKAVEGGRYPLMGVGDVNTYALFAESILQMTHPKGRAGFIVPSGIATDDSTKAWFAYVASNGKLASLIDFENKDALFPGVHRSFKFCLVTLGPTAEARFSFFLTSTVQVMDTRRSFALTPEDLGLLNPNTRTCPVFRSNKDAEVTKKIYKNVPVLIREGEPDDNPWGITFATMFHMSNDSGLFSNGPGPGLLPLHEAKMIHQFDHRWATYARGGGEDGSRDVTLREKVDPGYSPEPRYWVEDRQVLASIARVPRKVSTAWLGRNESALRFELGQPESDQELRSLSKVSVLWPMMDQLIERRSPRWLMGWRRNARANDERTTISTILPRYAVGDSLFLFTSTHSPPLLAVFLGNLNSLVGDFVARLKVGGVNFSFYYFKQLSLLAPHVYQDADMGYLVPRVIELTYTSQALAPWAEDVWNSLDADGRVGLLIARHQASGSDDPYLGPYAPDTNLLVWTPEILPPFPWNPDRRARLRAELDARYARLYGLTREELCYILDPASVMGEDYPSETFRVLKNNEVKEFGEYRTQRLVLEAWDAQEE